MRKLLIVALVILGLSLSPITFSDVPVHIFSKSGLKLTEEQKKDVVRSPSTLFQHPEEYLQQAIQAGPSKVLVIDETEEQAVGPPYTALLHYDRIWLSETRFVDPKVFCEGGGDPPQWSGCFDNSRFAVRLPDYDPIWINDTSMSDDEYMKILEVFDQAQLRTPNEVHVTSNDVNHILLRTRKSGIYVLIADTPSRETARLNLKRNVVDGNQSYEIVEWSCGDPKRVTR